MCTIMVNPFELHMKYLYFLVGLRMKKAAAAFYRPYVISNFSSLFAKGYSSSKKKKKTVYFLFMNFLVIFIT